MCLSKVCKKNVISVECFTIILSVVDFGRLLIPLDLLM